MITFPVSKRAEMANMYFFTFFLIFSLGFWIVSLLLQKYDFFLYLSTLITLASVIYGSLIILPSFKGKTGRLKVLVLECVILLVIITIFGFLFTNIFYLIWHVVFSLLIALVLMEDFHGLTPIYKSELGEKTWKKGEKKMKFMMMEIKLQPYGEIKIDREKCIGCKVCIDVCPRNIYEFNETDKKVDLKQLEKCINCNACVKRCLASCLEIT
jgi:NAD-dependent dihydropyrimidine dehydrogenase PreA subunit